MSSTEKHQTFKEILWKNLDVALFPIERPDFFLNIDEYFKIIIDTAKIANKEWLEQKNHKLTYLTPDEVKMEKEMVNLQVVLGLQSCKTKNDVCELLEDLRQHERLMLIKELSL